MALIKRRIVRFTGTITTDGSGNAAVDVAPGSAGGVTPQGAQAQSYKLIRVDFVNVDMTGTVNVRDNSGAGSAVNYTITIATDLDAGLRHTKTFNAPTPVTNVRFTVAGGGATKTGRYRAVFARTRAH